MSTVERTTRAGRTRPTTMTVATVVAGTVIFLLLAIPLAVQVITAFRGPFLPFGVSSARWSVDNFATLWELREDFWAVLGSTAAFVGGSTVLSLLMAFGLAWVTVRTDAPFRRVISLLVIVPFIVPPIVKAQAYLLMLSPESGVLNQLIHLVPGMADVTIDPYSFPTMIVIQSLTNVTFPFLMIVPILTGMDGSLEESARVSGASWGQTLRRVTLPMLWPGLLGVTVLTFILGLGSLEVPLLFGQESGKSIFALKLWTLISAGAGELPQYGLAAAWGCVFLVITTIAFVIYLRATRDAERRASISGKGFRPTTMKLGGWRVPVLLAVFVFTMLTAVLPLFALLWSAITPYPLAFSLDALRTQTQFGAFGEVLADGEFWASLGRTLVIAGGSATIACGAATVLAYGIARARATGWTRSMDLFASSSVAIPAVIAGFAMFLTFMVINPVIPLVGTIAALAIAYSYRVSIAYRAGFSATLQIRKELEEAALISGASRLEGFRRIVAPLLAPTVFAVWIQMFILGTNEFTLPAFLATPESRPLSVYMYAMINPRSAQLYAPDQGAAMALIFTLLVFAIGYGLQWLVSLRAIGRASRRGRVVASATDALGAAAAAVEATDDPDATDTRSVATEQVRELSHR
ncbi:ABC transporter permease [Agromyces luteolus]|uniref:ABC transporter permease subunit n=1 Tax=Agromyces luteolus TaxID=88373 RepID=A0A7C9HL89_9MICO|nr:iron ABC transporter permease [Agromyces luteolus]MUN07342.1 ABC transporter permease subunit [Agromyces luteolus]GLK28599.1 ABC transporter permease [Agromyces luteolus]